MSPFVTDDIVRTALRAVASFLGGCLASYLLLLMEPASRAGLPDFSQLAVGFGIIVNVLLISSVLVFGPILWVGLRFFSKRSHRIVIPIGLVVGSLLSNYLLLSLKGFQLSDWTTRYLLWWPSLWFFMFSCVSLVIWRLTNRYEA